MWKTKFDKEVPMPLLLNTRKAVKNFIETEIIEKIIDEIENADLNQMALYGEIGKFKQQLKAKWLERK